MNLRENSISINVYTNVIEFSICTKRNRVFKSGGVTSLKHLTICDWYCFSNSFPCLVGSIFTSVWHQWCWNLMKLESDLLFCSVEKHFNLSPKITAYSEFFECCNLSRHICGRFENPFDRIVNCCPLQQIILYYRGIIHIWEIRHLCFTTKFGFPLSSSISALM
jgi:hypothetical protein